LLSVVLDTLDDAKAENLKTMIETARNWKR